MAYFAFWNLENLFAPQDHPDREPWLARRIANDLTGWTADLLDIKLSQLTDVIAAMNDGQGPDVLGVCEVENRTVLELLVAKVNTATGRQYGIAHADSQRDRRGIDTAFLYDSAIFEVPAATLFSYFVVRRTGTRDITQITLKSRATGKDIVAYANHWPSRSGGEIQSAGFRAVAGETLAYWHERVREELGADTPIIAMGDFNDEPWSPSVAFNANTSRERGDIERSLSAKLYNLAWQSLNREVTDHRGDSRTLDGTLYYGGNGNLFDQILVNRSLLNGERGFQMQDDSMTVFAYPAMVDHRVSNGPIRFGLPKGEPEENINTAGFSDHFPVSVIINEI
ncbi:endonuclease/exonuclease/phosphatase family protein [Halioxenophilus aromaticivorans]|uniref:Endonuclease/exonuclease/phosphatase domain-containing protein n=1 Tax=Halioxenophilus aromaticivorans TaxID=1306992 RepID=A0AAV3U4X1_9ALTE